MTDHKSDLKNQIFIAATELFSTQGYYKVSVREICEAAGVTKPVLYYYFKDKESLLMEMMKETHKSIEVLKQQFVQPGLSFTEILKGILDLYLEIMIKSPHLMKFGIFIQFMAAPDNVKEYKYQTSENDIKELIGLFELAQGRGELDKKIDPKLLAMNFIGSVIMMVSQYLMGQVKEVELKDEFNRLYKFWTEKFVINKA